MGVAHGRLVFSCTLFCRLREYLRILIKSSISIKIPNKQKEILLMARSSSSVTVREKDLYDFTMRVEFFTGRRF